MIPVEHLFLLTDQLSFTEKLDLSGQAAMCESKKDSNHKHRNKFMTQRAQWES